MSVYIHSRVYSGTTLYIEKHLNGLNMKLLTRPSKKNYNNIAPIDEPL